jgi:hypothetical protein
MFDDRWPIESLRNSAGPDGFTESACSQAAAS